MCVCYNADPFGFVYRVDFNDPMNEIKQEDDQKKNTRKNQKKYRPKKMEIKDTKRIVAAVETIEYALGKGAKSVVLMSRRDDLYSLRPVAVVLKEKLNR